jgi:cyclopropane fatty-acyl-phospholipid synthase-like methyltransferase
VGEPSLSLKIPKDARLRFWDYYQNKNTPEKIWSTGLFRYVSDVSIRKYLEKQADRLSEKGHAREHEIVDRLLKFYIKP